jgi:hypothetical protein
MIGCLEPFLTRRYEDIAFQMNSTNRPRQVQETLVPKV